MENSNVQMVTMYDSRTHMVMYVKTKDSVVDLRGYGATCDYGSGYDGMDWDFD